MCKKNKFGIFHQNRFTFAPAFGVLPGIPGMLRFTPVYLIRIMPAKGNVKVMQWLPVCAHIPMKKGSLFTTIVFAIASLQAQSVRSVFQLSAYPGMSPAAVGLYSGSELLGTTDQQGILIYEGTAFQQPLRLLQDSTEIGYQLLRNKDSAGATFYFIRVMPRMIEAVLVSASRAEGAPVASVTVQKRDIEIQNTGRDLPVLLQLQPSVVITSDAGNGIGYTGIRVRGSDASRTNVTVNGVPINDAESQGTFWVNMPDLASSVGNIQIQRGAGTSANGAGAFGATVNVQTLSSYQAYGLLSNSAGSYGTYKNTIAAGTGLLNNHFMMDMRLSRVHSNGFVDRASSDLSSWFLSAGYVSKKWSFKLLNFSGAEKTYQAWNGIPIEKVSGSNADVLQQYNRNLGYSYNSVADSQNLFQSGNRTYNYYTYKNQTDNYRQNHYHAYLNVNLGKFDQLAATFYATHGEGYYEQYRSNDKVSSYGLSPLVAGTDTFFQTDLIRRQWLKNDLRGAIVSLLHNTKNLHATFSAAANRYTGDHYGEIVWAATMPSAAYLQHYYNSTGDKTDANAFASARYQIQYNASVFADMQVRRVVHTGYGNDNDLRTVNFKGAYTFFNPKGGLSLKLRDKSILNLSASVAHREPSRSDFTDNKSGAVPKPESMVDYEAGWKKNGSRISFDMNLYYMNYHNQLVLTGAVNDVGTPLRVNAVKSYRAGIEISAAARFGTHITAGGNIALSQNRIAEINTVSANYASGSDSIIMHKNVPISYSPATVAAAWFQYASKSGFSIRWVHKYVSRQYLDNSGDKSRSIAAYYHSEIWINKSWKLSNGLQVEAQLQVMNLFSNLYNNNGYTYDYFDGKPGHIQRIQEVFVFPSAPRNFMGGIVLKF